MCPPFVEGRACDMCDPRAYGYDPLIGCLLCQCDGEGAAGGQCDATTGQCMYAIHDE